MHGESNIKFESNIKKGHHFLYYRSKEILVFDRLSRRYMHEVIAGPPPIHDFSTYCPAKAVALT
jgi:hypothetical protein